MQNRSTANPSQAFSTQITEIENGFLVAIPPRFSEILQAQQMGGNPSPTIHYCEDYNAVTAALKKHWPVAIV